MRKILLLLLLAFLATAASAQLISPLHLKSNDPARYTKVTPPPVNNQQAQDKKLNVNAWYSFPKSMEDYYKTLFSYTPYTNIDPLKFFVTDYYGKFSDTATIDWFSFGAGFDPTDDIYDNDNDNATVKLPGTPATPFTEYTWDSVALPYTYVRRTEKYNNKNVVDTLYVQLYSSGGIDSSNSKWFFKSGTDTLRFICVPFDIKKGIATKATKTIKIQLTDKDTTGNDVFRTLKVPVNMKISDGGAVSVIYTYKPGMPFTKTDTLASLVDSPSIAKPVNSFRMLMYYDYNSNTVSSYNNGQVMQYQQRNNAKWLYSSSESSRYLPGSAFSYAFYPDIRFHISIVTAPELAVTGFKMDKDMCVGNSMAPQVTLTNSGNDTSTATIVTLKFTGDSNFTVTDTLKTLISPSNNATLTFKNIAINKAGTYNVQAYISQGKASNDTSSVMTLTVHALPEAGFKATIVQNRIFRFKAKDTLQASYSWDFGDGYASSGYNTTHNFGKDSTYLVTLKVTSPYGCVSQDTMSVKAEDTTTYPEIAVGNIGLSNKEFCAGTSINASVVLKNLGDASLGNIGVKLQFSGDSTFALRDTLKASIKPGDSATLMFNNIAINKAGNFSVQAFISQGDPSNDTSLVLSFISHKVASAEFTYTDKGGGTFNFKSKDNTPAAYSWDFGDGNTDAGFNVTHKYKSNGSYTVKLHTKTSYDCESEQIVVIQVSGVVGIADINEPISELQVAPNPFASYVNLNFILTEKTDISISLLSMDGKEIQVIHSGTELPGQYKYSIEAGKLKNAPYMLRIVTTKGVVYKAVVHME